MSFDEKFIPHLNMWYSHPNGTQIQVNYDDFFKDAVLKDIAATLANMGETEDSEAGIQFTESYASVTLPRRVEAAFARVQTPFRWTDLPRLSGVFVDDVLLIGLTCY